MNKTLILQKILSVIMLDICILCMVLLHDISMLLFCAPFYLTGLFSKEDVLCVAKSETTVEVSNGSNFSDQRNRQNCDKAV